MSPPSFALTQCADTGSSEHVGISENPGLLVSCPAAPPAIVAFLPCHLIHVAIPHLQAHIPAPTSW